MLIDEGYLVEILKDTGKHTFLHKNYRLGKIKNLEGMKEIILMPSTTTLQQIELEQSVNLVQQCYVDQYQAQQWPGHCNRGGGGRGGGNKYYGKEGGNCNKRDWCGDKIMDYNWKGGGSGGSSGGVGGGGGRRRNDGYTEFNKKNKG
eukprot:TRINITY_DN731_c0_g1_i15.p2 TRINITY_DN731_c0_g1~~TRINITY_DN731_c0_g1_i15.p2  ORF type:complete len:147 (+),score=50.83 TRINITY_DN731_c0_g1_i15:2394-2834(+)